MTTGTRGSGLGARKTIGPKNRISRDVWKRAQKIKLLAMDVDGVLTAGDIIILNSGEELKIWSVRDRVGFFLVHRTQSDLKLAWVTARQSEQVAVRAQDVKISKLYQNCHDKREALEVMLRDFGLKQEQVLFIGDDLIDLPVLRRVGLAVCPSDAVAEVKKHVHFVTQNPGGRGVFREAVEIVLKAQGLWEKATAEFYS